MYFDVTKKMQLKREVERVLHVKGNFKGGILEMAIVFDAALPLEEAKELGIGQEEWKDLLEMVYGGAQNEEGIRD